MTKATTDGSPSSSWYQESVKFVWNAPVIAMCAATLSFLFYTTLLKQRNGNNSKRVSVLVLGDIGRSPRMQNHAVALARAGWNVDLIGLKGAFLN